MAVLDSRNISGGSSSVIATNRLYNKYNVANWVGGVVNDPQNSVAALSGALTANTLVDLINESGSAGEISQFSIATVDATARTIRVVVTIDGIVIFDRTSASIAGIGLGCVLAGIGPTSVSAQLPPIRYANSKRIQYASSLTETGKFTTYLAFQDVT